MRWSALGVTLDGNGRESTLRQAVALLIEKLSESAVEDDPGELENFRTEINAIYDSLAPDLPPENLLTLAGSATHVLETYNRRITKTIGSQDGYFQTIIKMFQDNLVQMAGGQAESVQSLGRVSEELRSRGGFRDLEALKLQLGCCLSGVRETIEREKTASKVLIEKLQIEIESFRRSGARLPQRNVDAATGLSRQKDCLAAIREAIDRGTRHYAVVMIVNRVQPINARFGPEAGDWMLSRFKEYVETQLTASDRLFRWIGPAMVAILERPHAFEQVRGLVRRMLDSPLQKTYDIGGRSVLIPLSAAWSVIMLTSTPEATEQQIQAFIASQGCRDFV